MATAVARTGYHGNRKLWLIPLLLQWGSDDYDGDHDGSDDDDDDDDDDDGDDDDDDDGYSDGDDNDDDDDDYNLMIGCVFCLST